jgi:hypothetical protein
VASKALDGIIFCLNRQFGLPWKRKISKLTFSRNLHFDVQLLKLSAFGLILELKNRTFELKEIEKKSGCNQPVLAPFLKFELRRLNLIKI